MSRYFLITFSFLAAALVLRAQSSPPDQAVPTTLQVLPPSPAPETPQPDNTGTVGQMPAVGFAVPDSDYFYDPTGKRDPFRPWSSGEVAPPLPIDSGLSLTTGFGSQSPPAVQSANQATLYQRPVIDEEKYPLLARDVADYKVVGIVWDTGQPRAMVRDAKGFLHTIRPKSRLGYNGGIVLAIREGEIVVVETSPESGKTITRLVPLSRTFTSPGSLTPQNPVEGELPSPPPALRPAGAMGKDAPDRSGKL